MRVVTAHKSSHLLRVIVTGVLFHSSITTGGVNAYEYPARAILFICSIADLHRAIGPIYPTFEEPFTIANRPMMSGGIPANSGADIRIIPVRAGGRFALAPVWPCDRSGSSPVHR